MSVEFEVLCTNELPPLAEFLGTLKPSLRDLCKCERWEDLTVGAARVSILPGLAPYARRLVFSIRGGAELQGVAFVAWALVDVCGGSVRGDPVLFDYDRRIADDATAETCLAAIREANDVASLRAAFERARSTGDGVLFRRCLEAALAEAVRGRDELWEPIVRLARKEIQGLEHVKCEGKLLVTWLAQRRAAGVKLTRSARDYLKRNEYLVGA